MNDLHYCILTLEVTHIFIYKFKDRLALFEQRFLQAVVLNPATRSLGVRLQVSVLMMIF